MNQENFKVVKDNPEAQRRRRFWVTMVLALGLVGSYVLGVYDGKLKAARAERELSQNQGFLAQAEDALNVCRQSLSIATKRSEVDRLAVEKMRQQVADLRAEIANQQEDIAFYQNVMAGKKTKQSLKVEKIAVENALEPSRFRYQVVLAQVGKKHPWIKGNARVYVVGLNEGKKASFSLNHLNETMDQEVIPFRFRYFQKLEGELQIPDGFEPEYMQVRLQSEGRSPQVVEGQFSWSDIKGA